MAALYQQLLREADGQIEEMRRLRAHLASMRRRHVDGATLRVIEADIASLRKKAAAMVREAVIAAYDGKRGAHA